MIPDIENMSAEQLREIICIQTFQAKESKDQIAWYKGTIKDLERKTRILENEKESILKEKESILKQLQDLLEKFSSMKFELSQLKRLVFGSKQYHPQKRLLIRGTKVTGRITMAGFHYLIICR
jgi:TolA-binding protein